MVNNHIKNNRFTGNTLVYFNVGLVALVVAFLVIDNYILTDKLEMVAEKAIKPSTEVTETMNETVTDETKAVLHNSVAVLPFENLNPNPDDAYFAVGIHKEILDNLAKIRDITVIPGISVVRYQSSDNSIAEITAELNVATLMKGSVRYSDDMVNIAVQLFDASGNNQLWSEQYDRELSDIFVIQAEIIEHIAMALGAEVSAAEQERIDKVPTRSLEAYVLYLKARTLMKTISPLIPPEFYQILDQAIAIDPDFALAHAFKASGYGISKNIGYQLNGLTLDEMEIVTLEHIEKALAVDPTIGYAHMAQAFIHYSNRRGTETKQAFERALKLSPNDIEILDEYSRFLSAIEEHDEAIRLAQRVLELAPYAFSTYDLLGGALKGVGDVAGATDVYRQGIKIAPSYVGIRRNLGMMEMILGNDTEAIKQLRLAEPSSGESSLPFSMARIAYSYSRLGHQEDAVRLVNLIEAKIADGRYVRPGDRALSYLAIGEIDKAYNILDQNPNEGIMSLKEIKSNILNDPILEQPRFVELRKRIGTLD